MLTETDTVTALLNDDDDAFGAPIPTQLISVANHILHLSVPAPPPRTPILVNLIVDPSPGCGGVAWPAGQVLAAYLAKRGPEYLKGNILELGSGTGLVGLVAGILGGRVWITDQAPLLDIMKRNVSLNALEDSLTVLELNWGAPLPPIPRPDMVLAADCVYFEPAFPLLVDTLSDLADNETEILFCYKKRRKADKRFFTILRKRFSWTQVSDDPDQPIYSRDSISLLRLVKKW
jgi:predicted nicotinamide N-methyase